MFKIYSYLISILLLHSLFSQSYSQEKEKKRIKIVKRDSTAMTRKVYQNHQFDSIMLENSKLNKDSLNNVRRIEELKRKAEFESLPKHEQKMENVLRKLVAELKTVARTKENSARNIQERFSKNDLYFDPEGRIMLKITIKKLDKPTIDKLLSLNSKIVGVVFNSKNFDQSAVDELKRKKISVDGYNIGYTLIECYLPIESVEEIAKLINVQLLVATHWSRSNVGQVLTSGDGIHKADSARSIFYVDGSGVKVGVISQGIDHWQDGISSGDLPSSFDTIRVPYHSGSEGVASSEITHDIAPGATILYSDAGGGLVPMKVRIDSLKNRGCKVVYDDIDFVDDEAVFEDDFLATKINAVVKDGMIYLSSAGNYGTRTYDAIYASDANGYHYFDVNTTQNYFVVPEGDSMLATLQWSEKIWNCYQRLQTRGIFRR